jgi:hypothetical protein
MWAWGMRGRARAIGTLVLAAACGDGSSHPYPPEVVDNFMRGCTAQSAPATCRCALDALQERFSVEEFRGFEARMRRGEVPREMVDAASTCR